jgi:hypothetical protein
VNAAGQDETLPPSIGGLVDFAFAAYAARWPLYVGLAALVFAIDCAFEFAIPGAKLGTHGGDVKLAVLQYASIFADSFVVAAVAIGVGAHLGGETAPSRRIAGVAVERWLAVLATMLIVQAVIDLTGPLSGLGSWPRADLAIIVTVAPVIWLLWGMLGLAPPIAALSGERAVFAIFGGLLRAVSLSLRPINVWRLVVISFVAIVPSLLQTIALDQLLSHHVSRPFFWAYVPIDALTVGLLAAFQTTFALDFARRAGALETPRR